MQAWIRNTLFGVVLVCSTLIGMGVYLELQDRATTDAGLPKAGQLRGAPEDLPEFSLHDVSGKMRSISEWSGQPLLINFWATWCAPCRREIPLLQDLHTRKSISGIQVVGIAIDRQSDVEIFLAEYGVNYPNLVGEADAMKVSSLFGLDTLGLPFSVLSGANGKILTVHVGEIDAQQLSALIAISQAYEAGQLSLLAARDKLADI
jgi:thiol-disulfide isomerase/thioredoxin